MSHHRKDGKLRQRPQTSLVLVFVLAALGLHCFARLSECG